LPSRRLVRSTLVPYTTLFRSKSAYALLHGSDGLVPSTGNLAPSIYDEMYKAIAEGSEEKAYYYQRQSDLLGDLYQKGRTLGESRSEEHTSELQSRENLVCRLL